MVTANATATVTVNAAFLQEIKEVNQDLWHLLEEVRYLCSRPMSLRVPSRHFLDLLGALRDQLALHFTLEEAYGYFEDPLYVAPRLSEWAESLRRQHHDLYVQICQLVDYAERLARRGRFASLVMQVSQQFSDFYQQLQEHESQENALILQAYDDDIGVGD